MGFLGPSHASEDRKPARFQHLFRHLSVPTTSFPSRNPPARAASTLPDGQSLNSSHHAAEQPPASDGFRPAATSSNARASPAGHRSSPAAAAGSSATSVLLRQHRPPPQVPQVVGDQA